jgi:cob(I)alamin adenosyltransferase
MRDASSHGVRHRSATRDSDGTAAKIRAQVTRTREQRVKIYTRTGDDGGTTLFLGARVRKTDARVVAYGDVDEANATIGVVAALRDLPEPLPRELPLIMSDLFDLGAELATPDDERAHEKLGARLVSAVGDARVGELERLIDAAEAELTPLSTFVLPTGTECAARLHVARCAVRRAERSVVELKDGGAQVREVVLHYLNRLSDLLFVWSRFANARAGVGDIAWKPRKESAS